MLLATRYSLLAVSLAAGLFASSFASAAVATGTPTGDHLNPSVAGRGACIRLDPTPPASGAGFFCNYGPAGNPLYNEINNLLQGAVLRNPKLPCRLDYTVGGGSDGNNNINWISCPPAGGGV
jgi:hypothetical protein